MSDEPKRRGRPPKVVAEAVETPSLEAFIAGLEKDLPVLVEVSHPDADCELFQGRYSGIRVVRGPLMATYSDGTSI